MKPFRNGRHIPRRQRSLGRKFTWVECLKSALKRVVNCQKGISFANSKVERSREWIGKYIRPVVLLRIALHGHPDSGAFGSKHCEGNVATSRVHYARPGRVAIRVLSSRAEAVSGGLR